MSRSLALVVDVGTKVVNDSTGVAKDETSSNYDTVSLD